MDQRNETFVPHVLAVIAGTVVDFPNSDPTYPQRVLAVEAQALRPRPLCGRPLEVGSLRSAGRRARVLRHPLAHERVRAGVQPSILRSHRHRRPLPHRAGAGGNLHGGRLVRGRGARHREPSPCRPGPPSNSNWSRSDRPSAENPDDSAHTEDLCFLHSPTGSSWRARCSRRC